MSKSEKREAMQAAINKFLELPEASQQFVLGFMAAYSLLLLEKPQQPQRKTA